MDMIHAVHTLVACILLGTIATTAVAEQRPRLFVTPERVATIRQQMAVEDSTHQLAVADLKARIADDDLEAAYGHNATYRIGYKAVEAALLSAIVQDPAEQRRYAGIAYESMMAWSGGSATLGRSMETRCMALTYDWAYPAMTDAQRRSMRQRLEANVQQLAGLGHTNLGADRSSNFVGVIRGAELLGRLALGADVHDQRVQQLVGELRRYIAHFSDLGVSHEGDGYTEYPGGFFVPAILATRQLGDSTLWDQASRHAFWKTTMYTRSFAPLGTLDGRSLTMAGAEGWASLLLALCPDDQLPYYVYFYDRHIGRLVEGPREGWDRFDGDRHGTVWAVLFYPAHVEAKDPTGVFPPAIGDNHGHFFFRNRWQNSNDIKASITGQTHMSQRGWNWPAQLTIRVMGQGARWIGGNDGRGNDGVPYTTLLVDGRYHEAWNRGGRMGRVATFEPCDNGGYVVVRGGELYERLGLSTAERHMLVEFLPDNRAIVATLDRARSDQQRELTWQAAIGLAGNPQLARRADGGRESFVLTGGNQGFLRGWVLTSGAPGVDTGAAGEAPTERSGPLRISTRADSAEFFVVMLVGEGDVAAARIRGSGLQSQVHVAGRTLWVDAETKRIVVSRD